MARNYSRKEIPVLTDNALIWDSSASDWRLTTLQAILDLFSANEIEDEQLLREPVTQYAAPVAAGFDIVINVSQTDKSVDAHLILTPATDLADGTITLPSASVVRNRQTVLVNSTQQITTLTVVGPGSSGVYGFPTSLGADDFFRMKYDEVVNAWYRVG